MSISSGIQLSEVLEVAHAASLGILAVGTVVVVTTVLRGSEVRGSVLATCLGAWMCLWAAGVARGVSGETEIAMVATSPVSRQRDGQRQAQRNVSTRDRDIEDGSLLRVQLVGAGFALALGLHMAAERVASLQLGPERESR